MPRVRKGPNGPTSSQAGQQGTNRSTPHKGAGTSGQGHESYMKGGDKRFYGKPSGGKGYK